MLLRMLLATGILSLIVHSTLAEPAADIYLQGQIISTDDGLPVDSVRVGSLEFGSTAMSDRDGKFTLGKIREAVYRKPHSGANGRSILIRCRDRQILTDPQPGESFTIAVTDLHGRTIHRTTHRATSRFPIASTPLVSGVYLLSLSSSYGYRGQWKLLVSGAGKTPGDFTAITTTAVRSGLPGIATASSASGDNDTVFFCRDGYYTFTYPTIGSPTTMLVKMQKKRWIAFDIHNHTFLTDGAATFDQVLDSAFGIGKLDVITNSEHGGNYTRDTAGANLFPDGSGLYRWRTLSEYSWPKIIGQRSRFPGKTILQGLEWNVPGHEHASVGFLDDSVPMPAAIANFEYMFDVNDNDTAVQPGLQHLNSSVHGNAIVAMEWLQHNFRGSSYCFLNHPGHYSVGIYTVNDLRDFNNTAPDVCFGFEGIPGHQKYPTRGKYFYDSLPPYRTYGGADLMLAELGGVWDALLYEGRHFWPIVNSDFHIITDDFWPGEYSKTRVAVAGTGARAWLKGMKSGEMFVVLGDLIETLDFSVGDGINRASMGSDLTTGRRQIRIRIKCKSPLLNNHRDTPQVDHIDLIAGSIGGKIAPTDTARYIDGHNATTRVISRFPASVWQQPNGWMVIDTVVQVSGPTYFRLRGTNAPAGTPGELDTAGNPLVDEADVNTAEAAWHDLWFYSNPVFVYVK